MGPEHHQAPAVAGADPTVGYLERWGRYLTVQMEGRGVVALDVGRLTAIDPERSVEQLAETPSMRSYVNQLLQDARKSHKAAERQRRLVEANLDDFHRAAAGEGKKPTEAAIKNLIRRDPGYIQSSDAEDQYEALVQRFESLAKDMEARQYALQRIVETRVAEWRSAGHRGA